MDNFNLLYLLFFYYEFIDFFIEFTKKLKNFNATKRNLNYLLLIFVLFCTLKILVIIYINVNIFNLPKMGWFIWCTVPACLYVYCTAWSNSFKVGLVLKINLSLQSQTTHVFIKGWMRMRKWRRRMIQVSVLSTFV